MSDLTPQALVIPEWLLARHDLSLDARCVWAYIAMRQGRSAVGWPSVARMASDIGVNRKRIMRSVAELEAASLVAVHRKNGAKNRYSVIRNQSGNGTGADTGPVQIRDGKRSRYGTGPVSNRDGTGPDTGPHNPSKNLSKNPPSEPIPHAREEVVRFDPVHPDEQQRALRALIKRGFAERSAGQVYPDAALPPERVRALAAWMAEVAESRGHTWGAVALRTLDAWWLDEWAASKRWPFGHLAKNCARFEAPPRQPEGGEQLVGGMLAGSPGHVHEAALEAWEEPEWMRDEVVA